MEILNKERYDEFDAFCESHPHGAFQQSPRWGLVKTEWDNEVVVSRDENGKIVGGIFVLIRKFGIKTMMYACRGPVCDYTDTAVIKDLMEGVKVLARKHKAYTFIMDPLVMVDDAETIELFRSCGLKIKEHAPFHDTIQPRYNYMLRYIKGMNEDQLMKAMNRDTRYYLRYPEKKGVVCKNLGLEGLDDFYRIYSETGVRQKFAVRPKEYFVKMLNGLGDNCRLYMCYSPDGDALCGGVAVQYAGTTSHVYGCSNDQMRNLRPTYLLQKYLMLWALEGDCHTYDMQGVAPRPEDSEALYRILDFKSNFTGEIVETAGEFTITFDKLYEKLIDTAMKLRTKIKKRKK
ncbi:MAG: peptidoglycan bridge formation glycyltransferase FemA/FemB family protein [Oscillospiraceae bacterium]|nr:peptidoglycan bridge formation glycyltransferase FemA/FemB family protein [Oscillospiraceae bacterium]